MKLLPFLFLLSFACEAQIKIGDITISDSLAKEYFLDCYQYPETTTVKTKNYIKILADTVFWKAWTDTIKDGDWTGWDANGNRISRHKGKPIIRHGDAGYYVQDPIKYLIPRTPSASDFAAFMRRKYKTK